MAAEVVMLHNAERPLSCLDANLARHHHLVFAKMIITDRCMANSVFGKVCSVSHLLCFHALYISLILITINVAPVLPNLFKIVMRAQQTHPNLYLTVVQAIQSFCQLIPV